MSEARLAERLTQVRSRVAEAVTDAFLARHPDWVHRFGDRARAFGVQDALFHLDFLAGAIALCDSQAFEDYARWAARVLGTRGIGAAFLAENLDQLAAALAVELGHEAAPAVAVLAAGREACLVPRERPSEPERHRETAQLFRQAAIMGDRRAAMSVVRETLASGLPISDLYAEVLQPALREIGRQWEEGRLSVAQEHMATAVTQSVMAQVQGLIPSVAAERGRALLTTVPGERHQVGAQMVCDVLEADGWSVRFLGSDVPHANILQAVNEHAPHVVGISATTLLSVAAVCRLITALRTQSSARIVVGGSFFTTQKEAWRRVGADGCAADVLHARQLFARLLEA